MSAHAVVAWRARAALALRGPRALLLLVLCGLACRIPSPPPPPLRTSDPDAILRIVRQREDRIRTLRATFRATVRRGDDGARSLDGVLLVRKPDTFRLRLMLPLGLSVFDYLSRGERVDVTMLHRGNGNEPAAGDFLPFSRDDLGQAFLRGPIAFPGTCTPRLLGDLVVSCRDDDGRLLREIRIDARSGRIAEERSYRDDRLRLLMRFSDYRVAEGSDLPYRIVLTYADEKLEVHIEIDRYEINPSLDDHLFRPLSS